MPRAQSAIAVSVRRLVDLFLQASVDKARVQILLGPVRHFKYFPFVQPSGQLSATATLAPRTVDLHACIYFALFIFRDFIQARSVKFKGTTFLGSDSQ